MTENPDFEHSVKRSPAMLNKKNTRSLMSINAYDREVLSRSVYLEETGPSMGVAALIFIIAALIALFIIWSGLTRLDETVAARGTVSPISFVQPVQHLEGGIVASVEVEEGQFVKAGDPMLTMDKTISRSDYLALKVREASLALQIERLRAFALNDEPDFSAHLENYPELVMDQQRIFETQIDARNAQIAIINAQIQSRQQ